MDALVTETLLNWLEVHAQDNLALNAMQMKHEDDQNGRTVSELPLQVLEPVAPAGVFGRLWDSLRLLLQ